MSPSDPTRMGRILMVDDTAENIRVLLGMLKDEHQVLFALDGTEALAIAREQKPDLILLDALMPGMDGYAVCTALKAADITRDIPVIFVTALNSPVDVTRALAAGAVDFISKPVNAAVVRARVRTHLTLKHQSDLLRQAHAAERRARLAAEQANAAKSRFLAAASHDLRQPYQALRLLLATLQAQTNTGERVASIVRHMDVAMTAGEELLQSLLDLSTLEAGVVVPQSVDLTLADVMVSIDTRHRPVAEAKGLAFRVRPARGMVRADPVLLGRVLDNLISNAVRYTDAGRILVACRRRDRQLAIEVWDTGIGIAPEHQDTIFEEFYQVANPERDRTKGAGLGLAVVAKTVRLMGAELTMASRPGHGTRFRLVLAAMVEEEESRAAPGA